MEAPDSSCPSVSHSQQAMTPRKVLIAPRLPRETVSRPLGQLLRRHYTSTAAPPSPPGPAQPKKPSPYRLLRTHAFLAAFAPLHVAGWRLLSSSSDSSAPSHPAELDRADLQGRRLVRSYEFERTQEGWASATAVFNKMCSAAQSTNVRVVSDRSSPLTLIGQHHPSISLVPATEYERPDDMARLDGGTGYVLTLSVLTHSPLPPAGQPKEPAVSIQPGITTKDLQFAQAAEEAYEAHVWI